MKQIIAMGGGGFSQTAANQSLLSYCVAQVTSDRPKVAFLPQASAEDAAYIVQFYALSQVLNIQPRHFSFFGRVKPGWEEELLAQDIIYVGGGNTRSLLALWREWGVVEVLQQAYDQGVLMTGASAGAICWFEQGITDSVWPLGVLETLGWLPGSCCPHYDSEPERRPTYEALTRKGKVKPGIALEDYTAAHYVDGLLKDVVSSRLHQQAFWVENGHLTKIC